MNKKTKELTMNKLNKIGLTALAGSLAAIAGAHAGALTVSGGSNITYSTESGTSVGAVADTGNPLGWQNNLTFGASGELDNGISWSANAYNSDAQALTSSNITFDMGGMGKLLVDNGAGGAGLDALDGKLPNAFEEGWDTGAAHGYDTISGSHGSASLTWTSPADVLPLGTVVRLAYSPKRDGGSLQADKGNSGNANSLAEDSVDYTIQMAPMDGLSLYIGYAEIGQTGVNDIEEGTYGANYAMGPVSVGYQKSYESLDKGVTTTVNYYENTSWGIAFNVNDNLSVSYADYESDENLGTAGGQTVDIDSLQVAYNMGGATLVLAETDVDGTYYDSGSTNSQTLIAVKLAF